MTIDVEAFGLYLVLGVVVIGVIWAVWPLFRKDKIEEPKLDPVPVPAPVVEEVKPAPVASLEPVVAVNVDPVVEPVAVAKPKRAPAKKAAAKAAAKKPAAKAKGKK